MEKFRGTLYYTLTNPIQVNIPIKGNNAQQVCFICSFLSFLHSLHKQPCWCDIIILRRLISGEENVVDETLFLKNLLLFEIIALSPINM
jgi:hypothetical protein